MKKVIDLVELLDDCYGIYSIEKYGEYCFIVKYDTQDSTKTVSVIGKEIKEV